MIRGGVALARGGEETFERQDGLDSWLIGCGEGEYLIPRSLAW